MVARWRLRCCGLWWTAVTHCRRVTRNSSGSLYRSFSSEILQMFSSSSHRYPKYLSAKLDMVRRNQDNSKTNLDQCRSPKIFLKNLHMKVLCMSQAWPYLSLLTTGVSWNPSRSFYLHILAFLNWTLHHHILVISHTIQVTQHTMTMQARTNHYWGFIVDQSTSISNEYSYKIKISQSLLYQFKICGQSWISELSCTICMIDKIRPSSCSMPLFPSRRERPKDVFSTNARQISVDD